jgi:spermidine synthase
VELLLDESMVVQPAAGRLRLALALMLASGFAALGYQIVWTQQCALWLGHESASVLAVVAAFFGGLALGALVLGQRIERSVRPGRWYALCELLVGAWSLVLAAGMRWASDGLLTLIGEQPSPAWQWTIAFAGTFVLLLPATAAMGATLPAMERVLARWRHDGASLAALYAGNTFGAVLGVLATAFWLVPELGLVRTAFVCAGLNLLCAAIAFSAFSGFDRTKHAAADDVARPRASRSLLTMLAVTGLLGIGYEVLAVRVLSQVAQNTVYTFAILLAVYLVGSALGAAAWQRWLRRSTDPARLRDRLLCLLAAACLVGTLCLWGSQAIQSWALALSGPGMAQALGAEAAMAIAAFLLPTIAMGAVFSHLASQAQAEGISFSRSLGVNTLGAAAAPFVFGVWLVPAFGAKPALLLIVGAYLLLGLRHARRMPPAWALVGAVLALAAWAPPLVFVDVPEGGHVVSYREGAMAAVSVVEDADGVSRLRIDNRQQEGSSASLLADARQALLPLLLHPSPRRALFLGLGTGVTASSAAQEATLQVDAVELLPEVIEASSLFTPAVAGGVPNPRLHLIAADARRFVRASTQRYDLIVSDNFHPARSGSGALYTVEHFEAVRARLAPGGIFCQWLPLHQLDLASLRSIVAAFDIAYPQGFAVLATNSLETPVLGLVGREDGGRFDMQAVMRRLNDAQLPRPPAGFGLNDSFALMGSFVAGPRSLARFAGDAPVNTDDRPIVAYRAPRITYAPDSRPADRLVALLHELTLAPDEVLADGVDAPTAARLAAYWRARDRFIDAGRGVQPSSDVHRMLAQVRQPLLAVLRTSPDFRPAYDPLLRMATVLARSDAAQARALLSELASIQPARPEAARALRQLDGTAP